MKMFHAKKKMLGVLLFSALAVTTFGGMTSVSAAEAPASIQEEKLTMTNEWDKVFPQSDKVAHEKVTFHNRYGITLAADVYKPKTAAKDAKLAAIAVSGP